MEVGGQRYAPSLYHMEGDPVPITQDAGWGPQGRSERVRKFSSPPPTGIRSLDFPVCSESLYLLH